MTVTLMYSCHNDNDNSFLVTSEWKNGIECNYKPFTFGQKP